MFMFLHFLAGGFTGNIVTIDVQQAAISARSTWWSLLCAEAVVKEISILLWALIPLALRVGGAEGNLLLQGHG